MNVSTLSEEVFLCDGNRVLHPDTNADFNDFSEAFSSSPGLHLTSLPRLCSLNPSLSVVALAPGDTGLLTDTGELVGFYSGGTLMIREDFRGEGLSTPLILWAAQGRAVPTRRMITKAGEAALRKAWRVATGKENSRWLHPFR